MADVLTRFKSGKIWDFKGGIHPPEMKSQSNQSPIKQSELAHDFTCQLNNMPAQREMY